MEMTQIHLPDGTVVPVTLVQAGPCVVTQIKTGATDGYAAVQVGFLSAKHPSKPASGHLKDLSPLRVLREFRLTDADLPALKRGDVIDASIFLSGEQVNVSGVSKGKGFQGVVKRHGFHGHPSSHGHKDQLRMPGSIGAGGVQHVLKGRRMAGRMGHERVTVKNVKVVEVRDGLLALKGAIPGHRHTLIEIVSV